MRLFQYLNMQKLTVTSEYIDGFIQADQTFLYQLVYDPRERKLRPLNDYSDESLSSKRLPFCGEIVCDDLALGMALGNIDLRSLKTVSDFNPDLPTPIIAKPRYGRRANHTTIWNVTFTPERAVIPNEHSEHDRKTNNHEIITKLFSTPRPKFEDKTRMTRAASNIEYEDEDETIEKGTF